MGMVLETVVNGGMVGVQDSLVCMVLGVVENNYMLRVLVVIVIDVDLRDTLVI